MTAVKIADYKDAFLVCDFCDYLQTTYFCVFFSRFLDAAAGVRKMNSIIWRLDK